MVTLAPFIVIAAFQAIPCEYTIDLGATAAPFEYKMSIICVAHDGTDLEMPVIVPADTNPEAVRDLIVFGLCRNNWDAKVGTGNSIIVMQTTKGKSPMRSVTIKSEKVIPVTVRWSPVKPPKKK